MKRVIAHGDSFPAFYGLAWWRQTEMTGVCYPIPLNWIARWVRDAYYFLMQGPRRKQFDVVSAEIMRNEYMRGLQDGEMKALREVVRMWKDGAK